MVYAENNKRETLQERNAIKLHTLCRTKLDNISEDTTDVVYDHIATKILHRSSAEYNFRVRCGQRRVKVI